MTLHLRKAEVCKEISQNIGDFDETFMQPNFLRLHSFNSCLSHLKYTGISDPSTNVWKIKTSLGAP